jgi:hypothetical protein
MIPVDDLKYVVVGTLCLAAIAAAFFFSWRERWKYRRRAPRDLSEVFETEIRQRGIGWTAFEEVMNALGKCYSLDPRTIRPSEPLRGLLGLDSWNEGIGTEKLDEWLLHRAPEPPPQLREGTVLDLIEFVARSPGRKSDS